MDICATFQASSADCGRGFSLMNRTKTASRNCLGGPFGPADVHEVKAASRRGHQPGQHVQPLET